jgi:hypothetical protein
MPVTPPPSALFDARCWLTPKFTCKGIHKLRARSARYNSALTSATSVRAHGARSPNEGEDPNDNGYLEHGTKGDHR